MRRTLVIACLWLLEAFVLTPAYAMRNLAHDYPEAQLRSTDVLFIEQGDPLFSRYNRSLPPGRFLMIDRARLLEAEGPMELQRLVSDKPRIQGILENEVAAIDRMVSDELHAADIRVEQLPNRVERSEVPTRFVGWLAHYRFTRAWSYWVVQGDTSRLMAQEIYDNPTGRKAVRTGGYAGNISPIDYGEVKSYHIDTPEALSYFASVVRHHFRCDDKLAGPPKR